MLCYIYIIGVIVYEIMIAQYNLLNILTNTEDTIHIMYLSIVFSMNMIA